MANTGFSESTIRHATQSLVRSGVLAYDGNHGHVRQFRFNVASIEGGEVRLQAPTEPRQQPCNRQQGSERDLRRPTLQPAARTDQQDQQDQQDQITGAHAPGLTHAKETQPRTANNGRSSHSPPARKDEHVITTNTSLDELIRLAVKCAVRDATSAR